VHHLSLPFNPSWNVNQTWNASHKQWNNGAMDGFVTTTNSADPMGYLNGTDLPWYYAFARTDGLGDRFFSSVLAQTFPNRRFLQAATAAGLVSTSIPNPFTMPLATGLIWDLLDAHNIGWANYFVEVPEIGLWPRNMIKYRDHLHDIGDFYNDCRDGKLPPVSLLTTEVLLASEGGTRTTRSGRRSPRACSRRPPPARSGRACSS
jgi:phospholipase C